MRLVPVMLLVLPLSVLTVSPEPADESVADLFATNLDEERILRDDNPEPQALNSVSVDVRTKSMARAGYYYYYKAPSPSPAWPTFASPDDLGKTAWGTYYKLVFGEIPTDNYPRSPESLWMFYSDVISQAGVTEYPHSVGECPTDGKEEGQVYTTNNVYSPSGTFWSWHPYPYRSYGSHTWCEVMHEQDPYGDEQAGAWFMHAPGSAIYFDIGVTLAFSTHTEAYDHWGVTGPNWNQDLSTRAASDGYDSLQFTAHVDHVNYPCDTHNTGTPDLEYMGLEIVGVKLVGSYACGWHDGAPDVIRAGWWKTSKPCTCDNGKKFLNCNEVPSTAEMLASGNFSEILKEWRERLSVQV